MIYDAIIIGAGPAGLSAALNLKILGKRFLWIGSRDLSSRISRAERISNYPGFHDVSGRDLCDAFLTQIGAMGIDILDSMVNAIIPMGDHYAVAAGPEYYEARTLLLATGVNQGAGIPGEAERLGMGVSYCATCDGMLYRGRTIAVVCGNARFEHEARFLAGLAAKVYFFPYYAGSDDIGSNVETPEARPVRVLGEPRVTGLLMNDGTRIDVDGLFCLRDAIAPNTLLPDLRMTGGHIDVNRSMATSMSGIFAAGDCTGRPYQYAKAVGEGNVAAHSIIGYLK